MAVESVQAMEDEMSEKEEVKAVMSEEKKEPQQDDHQREMRLKKLHESMTRNKGLFKIDGNETLR